LKSKARNIKRSSKIQRKSLKANRPRRTPNESEEIVFALRRGKVDALVTDGAQGNQIVMLQGADHPYRVLVEKINDGAATLDRAGTILYANSRFVEILNAPSENFVGTPLQNHLPADDRKTLDALIAKIPHGSVHGEINFNAANGRPRLVRLALHPSEGVDEKHICVVATELTELVEANEALRTNEESLRLLSARLLKLQDEERRHIARDLHDITGQKLAVQSMTLGQVLKSDSNLNADSRRMLAECVNLNKVVGEEIRTLSYLLHPPLLDELGLCSAVKWYAEGFEHKTGIRLEVDMPSDLQRLPQHTEVTLFRVIQESLTNMHRYSGSPNGFIRVKSAENKIEVQVGDFGRGIDKEQLMRLEGHGAPLGVGIQGMKERMRQLGGELAISSEANKGTIVNATLTLSNFLAAEASRSTPSVTQKSSLERSEASAPERNTSRKTILIVDDHEMLRRGIRMMLQQEVDFEVCGEAADGEEAVQKATALHPDLVIIDINLPILNGLAAIRQISRRLPQTKILVFTVHDPDPTAKESYAAGAHAYVSKSKGGEDLLRVMKELLKGKSALGI
jgi:PAS domain S-box-containing protein